MAGMLIVWGTRLYGTVDRCGSSRIGTKFFHFYWLPLVPLGSILVTEDSADGTYRGIAVPLSGRSVLAAYGRIWLPFMALLAGLSALNTWSTTRVDATDAIVSSARFGALVLGAAYMWLRVGKLSLEQRAQHLVYAEYMGGVPLDVARLGDGREPLRQSLLVGVSERAAVLAATGYRLGLEPGSGWDKVALDANVRDRDFLSATLTLARLEWSQARGGKRAERAECHRKIWARLKEVDPSVLTTATTL